MLLHMRNKFINIFKTSQCTKSYPGIQMYYSFNKSCISKTIQVLNRILRKHTFTRDNLNPVVQG